MVKRVLLVPLFIITAALLMAEGNMVMDFYLMNTIIRTDEGGEGYWGCGTSGTAGFSFKSSGSRNVKGEVSYDFTIPEYEIPGYGLPYQIITLDRAYVKARFPVFRLTAGKTRLGWGDGFVFNSGDVIFGSVSPYVDLTAEEIRSETGWMTAFNIPFGRFSFVEVLAMAPEPDYENGRLGELEDSSAGGRIYTKAGGIKIEAGYMLRGDGDESLHRPYISLQGNFGPDWYIAASAAYPFSSEGDDDEAAFGDFFEDTFNISFGLFSMYEINRSSSITFRLEGLIMPYGEWEEYERMETEENPDYGILFYPEIVYIPDDTVSVSLRSIVAPVDLSAQITAGINWNVFEGFSIMGYGSVNTGDSGDTFVYNDLLSFSAGLSYIY